MISHMLRYLHANQSYGTFKAKKLAFSCNANTLKQKKLL